MCIRDSPYSPDLGWRLSGHRKGDLKIMNHQVEDHIDVDRTRGERRESLRLEITNVFGETQGCLYRGVVIFDVTDGEDF